MKIPALFAALLLSASAYAQTTPAPTPAPSTPPSQSVAPAPAQSGIATQKAQRSTIDQRVPSVGSSSQKRLRNRQTVMDGQASPGVETTKDRRTKRPTDKKLQPLGTPPIR